MDSYYSAMMNMVFEWRRKIVVIDHIEMSYFRYEDKQIYLEYDMFPKGHCKVLFGEICAKTSLAKTHIFEHGGHPAMLSNMDEFVDLINRIIDEE